MSTHMVNLVYSNIQNHKILSYCLHHLAIRISMLVQLSLSLFLLFYIIDMLFILQIYFDVHIFIMFKHTPNRILFCLFLVLIQASCYNYFLISELQDVTFYRCLKQGGVNEVGIIVESDTKGLQKEFLQNVANAKNAGMAVQVVFTLCREKSQLQIQQIVKNLGPKVVDKFWVIPFNDNQPSCMWGNWPEQANCEYFSMFLNQLRNQGIKTEVITSAEAWIDAFKNRLGCPQVNSPQLWYIPGNTEEDWQPNFNSYKQIGGWKAPFMKLYSQKQLCGQAVLLNYYQ